MPSTKRTMVRHELSSSLPHVLPLILQVLQQPSQGTIHILRKHLYSTEHNLTFKIFTKTGFFCQSKGVFFQH